MTLADRITHHPRPFDPDRAGDAIATAPWAAGPLRDLIGGTAGCSPYLSGLIAQQSDWQQGAVDDPEAALAQTLADIPQIPFADLGPGLRRTKARVALLTALCDLGGVWPLETVTQALTDLAAAAVQACIVPLVAAEIVRDKLPGLTPDDAATAGGMVVLAMGKQGAGELNYSSDIDLICLFDDDRFTPEDSVTARAAFVRVTRRMCALLSDNTAQGYVFRTDLRLRPDASVMPVCLSMTAAERYYESVGRTWERAAYIKAAPCAGDLAAGQRFLDTLRPFVWRKHLDFAAIQDAHDMRLAIREHKGLGGSVSLSGHNMKLGRGGIREIEFFTQTRQLIAGGRDADLRVRGTCEGMAVLAEKEWIPAEVAETLCDHYRAHRTVEHRVQMIRDAQTHTLPQTEEGFDRLAAMMDMDVPALRSDLERRLEEVHQLTEGFFAGSTSRPEAAAAPEEHVFDAAIVDRWLNYPALRSARGAELFAELKPGLLARLARATKPDEALLAFDGFLGGLPAGVQLFSLLKINPQLSDLLVDIVSASPALAAYLSRNAQVFDAVIGGDFFSEWPAEDALVDSLTEVLEAEEDYEARLDTCRRWAKEWHFRIGVHHLRGLIDAATVGAQYADLARAVLRGLWPVVIDEFSRRHGPPPGRGAVLVGMGSLGARRLTAASDLDMIVVYDSAGVESSDGKRPLASRLYYARLTQAMITAMTAPMAQGKLYEVDMRLRPSGTQGPVATSLASFESYQMGQAWVWEHLALTRADCVTGPDDLMQDVARLCDKVLARSRDRADTLHEVAAMRARLATAKVAGGIWDAKNGPGRLQDIELLAQAGALLAGTTARDITSALGDAEAQNVITADQAEVLRRVYRTCWALQSATRLLSSSVLREDSLGQAGLRFLCRSLDVDTPEELHAHLAQSYDQAATIIADALAAYVDKADGGAT